MFVENLIRPEDRQVRTIRVGGGDRHVNIIFVKAPSPSSSQQTEVILPEQDEHKNLVYVLLNENAAENDIKITRPAARGNFVVCNLRLN